MGKNKNTFPVHRPKTMKEFRETSSSLVSRRFVPIEALKPGPVRTLMLGDKDPSSAEAKDLAATMGGGAWSNGPLSSVAWSFDSRVDSVKKVVVNGQELGLGYVEWGPGNNVPSTIPPLAYSLPYTAAPLRYLADLTAGLGPKLMYRMGMVTREDRVYTQYIEYRDAGLLLRKIVRNLEEGRKSEDPLNGITVIEQEVLGAEGQKNGSTLPDELDEARKALLDWERTWYGYEEKDENDDSNYRPGAKQFLEENNLDLHIMRCEQDDVALDFYFPTVGFEKGRANRWGNPKIVEVSVLPAHSTRLEKMNENRHINHVYFSDNWRTLGQKTSHTANTESQKIAMYSAAMPQHLLRDLRYIVKSNQRTRISKGRPLWVVCPTFYPSGQKPYYSQPAWWSVFTSKAFDFSSTILYDKAKARENKTSWGKIFYISLDWLEQVMADEGLQGKPEEQQEFIDELERSMEDFLQHRENHGKMMRQWMWEGKDGKEHHNIEIVDVAETTKDAAAAGKDELEMATSPIFLALGVDPRLVGVPMVHSSNGGTALREMHLLKQQQLNVKQRLYLQFLNTVARFNEWDDHAEFIIKQQTLTTLDNSKTGTVETTAGEGA